MKIYEDEKYLKSEEDIQEYFEEAAYDILECGQGYYDEQGTAFAKIGNNYYLVKFIADIDSAKQDRGDRLYWVDKIKSVTWEPVTREEVITFINEVIYNEINKYKKKIEELETKLMV